MNSVNYQGLIVADEISREAMPVRRMTSLSDLARPDSQRTGATAKQRALVGGLVIGVQAFLILGLAYGLTQKPKAESLPPMVVDLIPMEEEQIKAPPPPMKPLLATPQIVMDMPVTPQIYEPPPLVKVDAPPSTMTASATPPKGDPKTAVETFQMKLLRHVNQNLRYPPPARVKRQEGVVMVRFAMDRRGYIRDASVETPSRFAALNDESLAVLARAQPFPPPPVELEGDPIQMILPVKFSLR